MSRDSTSLTNTVLATMSFQHRLVALRKERGLTQQQLADVAGLNIVQIGRYETNASRPSIEAIKKLAVALSVPTDLLLFDDGERGPAEDLRLEFEAVSRLDPAEKETIRSVIHSVVVQHDVKRLGSLTASQVRMSS